MKITRSQLQEILKECRTLKEQYSPPEYTPDEQAVIDAMENLKTLIATMGSSNPDMTDYYIGLFRALEKAGLSTKAIAMSV
jgi:hypothetical protein